MITRLQLNNMGMELVINCHNFQTPVVKICINDQQANSFLESNPTCAVIATDNIGLVYISETKP